MDAYVFLTHSCECENWKLENCGLGSGVYMRAWEGRQWLVGQCAGTASWRTWVQVLLSTTNWQFSVITEWPKTTHILSLGSPFIPDSRLSLSLFIKKGKKWALSSSMHKARWHHYKTLICAIMGWGQLPGPTKNVYWCHRQKIKKKKKKTGLRRVVPGNLSEQMLIRSSA